MFDSDDEDEPPVASRPLSKRQRMEALQAKKRQEQQAMRSLPDGKKEAGYDSGDSYDSEEYVRTKEDNDFIDTEGDDADAIAELYAEQRFDDERGEAMEEPARKKKVKGAGSSRGRSERAELEAEADDDNPIMQAVNKMKRRKREKKKIDQLLEEAAVFLEKMQKAAEEDEEAISQKRPALKKLSMLNSVCETLANRELAPVLLDNDLLVVCKRWIQPLPNGTLGNVTVRQKLLDAISKMKVDGDTGTENAITTWHLKKSELGKVVMSLYMHKSEIPSMKRQLKDLIEQWTRPVFKKSGNMRDLEHVQRSRARGDTGLSAIARTKQREERMKKAVPIKKLHRGGKDQDLNSLIKSGAKGKIESGINRVRVPFSQGFQYTVRPQDRRTGSVDKRRTPTDSGRESIRGRLGKRMVEKGRTVSKNQRSANVSIEGRQVK